jgi:hypothetical protein
MGGIFVNTTSTKRLQDEPKATCNNADDMSLGTMKEEDSQIDQDLKFAAEQHIGCFICQPLCYDYFPFCVSYRVDFHANSSNRGC